MVQQIDQPVWRLPVVTLPPAMAADSSRVPNVDMAVSGDELRDAASLARECVVVGRAVTLARWVGTGRRPVTAGQVLRKADVPAAGAAVGVDVPQRLRTMADIPVLHRPWCVAVATGLLQVGGGWVSIGPALEHWRLAMWTC